MTFRIRTSLGEVIQIQGNVATIGRDPDCTIAFPQDVRLKAEHAVLRRVADRWLVEARSEHLIQVGDGPPARMVWVKSGDVVHLTAAGPQVTIESTDSARLADNAGSVAIHRDISSLSPGEGKMIASPVPSSERRGMHEAIPRQAWLPTSAVLSVAGGVAGVLVMVLFFGWIGFSRTSRRPEPPPVIPSTIASEDRTTHASDIAASMPPRDAQASRGKTEAESTWKAGIRPPAATKDAAEQRESAVVWLGFRLSDYLFLQASGWVAAPDRVVTTGAVAARLQLLLADDDVELVVHAGGRTVTVKQLLLHPRYDPDQPGSRESIHHNVGVAVLDAPLDLSWPLASGQELDELSLETPLVLLGFISDLKTDEPYDRLRVRLGRVPAAVTGSDEHPSGTVAYQIKLEYARGMDGAPILNMRGRVVGVLTPLADGTWMVPIAQLAPLLE